MSKKNHIGADGDVGIGYILFQKASAKVRDNSTCQKCGKKGGRLHVHHIKPIRLGGSHELDNLITLCPKCHGEEDAKVMPRKGIKRGPHEITLWKRAREEKTPEQKTGQNRISLDDSTIKKAVRRVMELDPNCNTQTAAIRSALLDKVEQLERIAAPQPEQEQS